jgi:hypothetical protein
MNEKLLAELLALKRQHGEQEATAEDVFRLARRVRDCCLRVEKLDIRPLVVRSQIRPPWQVRTLQPTPSLALSMHVPITNSYYQPSLKASQDPHRQILPVRHITDITEVRYRERREIGRQECEVERGEEVSTPGWKEIGSYLQVRERDEKPAETGRTSLPPQPD